MVGGRRWGRRVVRVKVRAWKREKTMYGRRVTIGRQELVKETSKMGRNEPVIGLDVNQYIARRKYWTFWTILSRGIL